MPSYRRKPVVIQATQWHRNGDHPEDHVGEELPDPFGEGTYKRLEGAVVRFYRYPAFHRHQAFPRRQSDNTAGRKCKQCDNNMRDHGWIETLDGGHVVCPGDWIITGVRGEMYPCEDAIFQAAYEAVT